MNRLINLAHHSFAELITVLLLSISIVNINTLLTTLILILTTVYWIKKNIELFKGNHNDGLPD